MRKLIKKIMFYIINIKDTILVLLYQLIYSAMSQKTRFQIVGNWKKIIEKNFPLDNKQ